MCYLCVLLFSILDTILYYLENLKIDIHREMTRFTQKKKKKTSVLNNEMITKWWKELKDETETPEKFLEAAANELIHGRSRQLVEVLEDGKYK